MKTEILGRKREILLDGSGNYFGEIMILENAQFWDREKHSPNFRNSRLHIPNY